VVKPDHPISYSGLSGFRRFSEQQHDMSYTEDLKIQDVLRHEKGLKGIKEPRWKKSKPEVEVAKNWTVRFWITEYPIFPEQIQSQYSLRFSLFRKDLVISDSKSYVLLPI
jgi:hypothetical protein